MQRNCNSLQNPIPSSSLVTKSSRKGASYLAFLDPRLFHPVWNVCRRPHSPSVSVTWLESTSHPGVLPSFFPPLVSCLSLVGDLIVLGLSFSICEL